MFKTKLNIVFVFIALILLVCVRAFENALFYDPFMSFYKSEYFHKSLPTYNTLRLLLNLIFRYFINSVISIAVIYLLFKSKSIFKLSVYLYIYIGIGLLVIFFMYLKMSTKPDFLILFYIRRFLIQPVLLVLFIPAFYYQTKTK